MNISLFEEANNALDGGDANKAFHIFMQDAKNGGTDSWNSVGFLYDHGRGVKKPQARHSMVSPGGRQGIFCCMF